MSSVVQIKGSKELIAKVRKMSAQLLPEIAPAVEDSANLTIAMGQINVPENTGDLASTAFVDGPVINPAKHSVSATCGYESPHAGAVHEGFHFGLKNTVPPKWLEHAAAQAKSNFRAQVGKQTKAALERLAR